MPLPDAVVDVPLLTETAYAKINLALHVRGRRDDGYHALESLFVFAEDGDVLTAEARSDDRIELLIDGPFAEGLDSGADNLVVRAALALRSHAAKGQGATIRLTKNLPVASGIGGGSADAAATLRMLTALWSIDMDETDLAPITLRLGSDVPACLASVSQFVRGRGEDLGRHNVPGLTGMSILLVNPLVAMSTAQVFSGWDRVDRGALDATSLDELIAKGRNDLEASAMHIAPIIREVLDRLSAQSGVLLSRMSGSGATCFALFKDEAARDAAALAIAAARPEWWTLASRIRHA